MQNVQQLLAAFKECTKTDWLWLSANKETSNTLQVCSCTSPLVQPASSRTNLQGILGKLRAFQISCSPNCPHSSLCLSSQILVCDKG